MTRALCALCLSLLTGCIASVAHTVREVEDEPLTGETGRLRVLKVDGQVDTFEAPYVAAAGEGILMIKATGLTPNALYGAPKVVRLEAVFPSVGKTAAVATGVLIGAAYVAGVVAAVLLYRPIVLFPGPFP